MGLRSDDFSDLGTFGFPACSACYNWENNRRLEAAAICRLTGVPMRFSEAPLLFLAGMLLSTVAGCGESFYCRGLSGLAPDGRCLEAAWLWF